VIVWFGAQVGWKKKTGYQQKLFPAMYFPPLHIKIICQSGRENQKLLKNNVEWLESEGQSNNNQLLGCLFGGGKKTHTYTNIKPQDSPIKMIDWFKHNSWDSEEE